MNFVCFLPVYVVNLGDIQPKATYYSEDILNDEKLSVMGYFSKPLDNTGVPSSKYVDTYILTYLLVYCMYR